MYIFSILLRLSVRGVCHATPTDSKNPTPYTIHLLLLFSFDGFQWSIIGFVHLVQRVARNWCNWCVTGDEVIMCRSRLGFARLTHSYLFRNEDPPECIYCACRLTVKHILIECPDFELSRQKYFNCNTLPELFEKTPEANIMTYLKEIGLYSRF